MPVAGQCKSGVDMAWGSSVVFRRPFPIEPEHAPAKDSSQANVLARSLSLQSYLWVSLRVARTPRLTNCTSPFALRH